MMFRTLTKREIRNDEDLNSYYTIAPDDMGCVEIKGNAVVGKIAECMQFPPDEARHIAKALICCADEIEGLKDNA